jgi:aryl-alcohol dehydrogenase-like predicted oxidoreductase
MQYRKLGSSDLKLSVLGLGCNNFGGRADLETTRRVVHHAIDAGINHFDTADIYGGEGKSEEFLGQVLGPRRKDIILATKFGLPFDAAGTMKGGSRKYVMSAVEASLKRLKTDYIDLYYHHKPDPTVPVEETLRALDDLVKQGKVRAIANSNYDEAQIADADATAKKLGITRFVAAQDELSLIKRGTERERIPAMQKCGLAFIPYFPLASGLLTGKYRRNAPMPEGTRLAGKNRLADVFWNEANLNLTYQIGDFCDRRKLNMLDVAFAWLLAKPIVTSVIAGAVKTKQIDANVKACAFTLEASDAAELDKITSGALASQPH